MAETTATRIDRIVQMVAELSHKAHDGHASVRELADSFGVSEREIARDLEVLGNASDNPRGRGLNYVAFEIEKGRVHARFTGAFQRPLVLNRDEALALGVALGTDREAGDSLLRLLPRPAESTEQFAVGTFSRGEDLISVFLNARQLRRCVEIVYAGAGDVEPSRRVIEPHQVVDRLGVTYIVAWCEAADGKRIFRIERVLSATMLDRDFVLREELLPVESVEDLDHRSVDGETVTVKFSPRIARWLKERHPDGVEQRDGSLVVEFTVWNPDWLVQHVLQYGPEAEVLSPESYRFTMRKAVAIPPSPSSSPDGNRR